MAILTIGRVGLETADLGHPREISVDRSFENAGVTIRGFIMSTTLANAKYLRNELISQQGQLVAVTYTLDSDIDGFYILRSVQMESMPNSYRIGLWLFEADLFYIGNHSSTELQSLLTVGDIDSFYADVPAPYHGVPVGALAYNAGIDGNPLEYFRESADGTVSIFWPISYIEDPTWAVAPANYYLGGVKLYTQGLLRAGLTIPFNDPSDWYMSNGLVEVRAQNYQSTSNGRIELRFYSGSAWSSWIDFYIQHTDLDSPFEEWTLPQWHYITIIRNTPEVCTLRLVRDAATNPPSAHRHILDIQLRRGSHFATFIRSIDILNATAVYRDTPEAATRPGGTASYIYATANTDGMKWIMGSSKDFTADTTNGGFQQDAPETYAFPFWIGFLKGGSTSNDTGDGPLDLAEQFAGWVAETVRGVRR